MPKEVLGSTLEKPSNSPPDKEQDGSFLQNFDNFPQDKADFFAYLVSKVSTEGAADVVDFTQDLQLGALDWLQFRLSSIYYGEGAPKGKGAIVIVPGFATIELQYLDTATCLKRLGYNPKIYPPKFFFNVQSVEDQIEDFGKFLKKVKDTQGEKIALIGHSIGGLTILATYFQNPEEFKERVSQVFLVGAPFPVARVNLVMGSLYLGFQLLAVSDDFKLAKRLKDNFSQERFDNLSITSIVAKNDPVIQGGVVGDQLIVAGSHSSLLQNRAVLKIIAQRLASSQQVNLAA